MAVNKFIGIGNLGKDPEIRYMQDEKCVANISIGISEKYKDKQGQQKETTEWVNVVFFGKLAEIVGQYLKKGSQVYVEGKLKTEKYEKDGQTRYSTKVIADSMKMLGGKTDQNQNQDSRSETQNTANTADNLDDEIPF